MEVRIQDIEDDLKCYYDGTLHPSLIQVGVKLKIGMYSVQVKEISADVYDDSSPVVLLVEEI